MKVADYISKHKCNLKKLHQLGYVNNSILVQYQIYLDFKKYRTNVSKMTRYQWVADDNNVSTTTVRNAIKAMGKQI